MKLEAALASMLVLAGAAQPALAQQAAGKLSLELNAAQPTDKGCRFTFVVKNELDKPLSRAAFEMALFNDAGVVGRLSVLEFKDLPAGRTKVSRFELPGVDCAKTSRILLNSATACEGDGVDPAACGKALSLSSKTTVAFDM